MFLFGHSTHFSEVIYPRCDPGLISFFLSNRQVWVVLDGKYSQDYPVNAGVPQAPFLVLHLSYYTLMTFLMMLFVILLSADDTTLYSKCDIEY